MSSQVNAPPDPQPIQQAESGPAPTLQQGCFQGYEGNLRRKSKVLKRWKLEWLKIEPGEHLAASFLSCWLASYSVEYSCELTSSL